MGGNHQPLEAHCNWGQKYHFLGGRLLLFWGKVLLGLIINIWGTINSNMLRGGLRRRRYLGDDQYGRYLGDDQYAPLRGGLGRRRYLG